jgi:pantothenate kinase-related protein Tda10
MGVYSITTETHSWLAIVRADSDLEAVMVAVLAMEGWDVGDEPVHVLAQHTNPDAMRRLGDAEMIGWQLC